MQSTRATSGHRDNARDRERKNHPVVLSIAGSDSGGGAGIQADLKTITSLKCYGATAITALTAQNTKGVQGVQGVAPDFIKQQLNSVLGDFNVSAIKTGMLYDAETVRTIATTLKTFYKQEPQLQGETDRGRPGQPPSNYTTPGPFPPLIVDPVCVSTSGHTLLEPSAVKVLIEDLIPFATVLTPNVSEAELLLSSYKSLDSSGSVTSESTGNQKVEIKTVGDALRSAKHLAEVCNRHRNGDGRTSVLLKGGHLVVRQDELTLDKLYQSIRANSADAKESINIRWSHEEENMCIIGLTSQGDRRVVVDILYHYQTVDKTPGSNGSGSWAIYARPWVDTTSTHGTGCTLSSAIACFLARGHGLLDAVERGVHYTNLAILTAFPVGTWKGHGPLNHMHAILSRQVPMPSAADPYPFTRGLIRSCLPVWKDYVEHPFVVMLGMGTLPVANFKHFIVQDYHYLRYYARAHGLLAAKSRTYSAISKAVEIVQSILLEMQIHRGFCAEYGVSELELENATESPMTTAYGAYLLDVGVHGDEFKLIVALSACLLGYGEVGLSLVRAAASPESKIYLEGNPYLKWIQIYSGDAYQNAVRSAMGLIESYAEMDPPSKMRLKDLQEVWRKSATLEKGFWDMAMTLA